MIEDNQSTFAGTALLPDIRRAIASMGFVKATPVQEKTIASFLEGHDLIVQAPTGTGKTGAFGIPISQLIDSRKRSAQALIMSPTRELAIQTTRVLQKLTQFQKGVRIVTLYGGEPIGREGVCDGGDLEQVRVHQLVELGLEQVDDPGHREQDQQGSEEEAGQKVPAPSALIEGGI